LAAGLILRRPTVARLGLVGVLALAVRLVYVLAIARAPVGIGGDAGFYHSAADLIAHGHFLYRGIFGHAYVTAEHPPLFPLVLSLSTLLGAGSILAHRIVGVLIGSLATVAIAALADRFGSPRAGLLAGTVAAFYPPLVTADGLVMSEPLFVLTAAASLLLAVRVHARARARDSALLGLVIGLATLTRGEGVLLVPLLGWPAALLAARRGRVTRTLAVTLATALVLAPWVVRNAIVFHRPMLAADANTLLAGANCPDTYNGYDLGWWSLSCEARARTRWQLLHGDASTAAAWRYAGDHAGRLPVVAAVRVLRTFDLFQPLRQGNLEPRRRWVDVVGLGFFYPVMILAGVGLWRLRRLRWVLLAPIWMVVVVSALGWGIGRFRVAADISLLVLAACAVAGPRSPSGPLRRQDATRRRSRSVPQGAG
jgi:4-amino-4-deoxy-L-arabinose transferase-like glycosyltransferase